MQIYYAHHLWKYNTEIEKYELNIISKWFPNAKILNPNIDIPQNISVEEIMNLCLISVEQSDILIFSSISGVVGKGVVKEVMKAKETNKSIFYINENTLKLAINCEFELIDNGKDNRLYALVKL